MKKRPTYIRGFGIYCYNTSSYNPKIIEVLLLFTKTKHYISLGNYKLSLSVGTQIISFDQILFNDVEKIKFIIKESYGGNKVYINNIYLYEKIPDNNNFDDKRKINLNDLSALKKNYNDKIISTNLPTRTTEILISESELTDKPKKYNLQAEKQQTEINYHHNNINIIDDNLYDIESNTEGNVGNSPIEKKKKIIDERRKALTIEDIEDNGDNTQIINAEKSTNSDYSVSKENNQINNNIIFTTTEGQNNTIPNNNNSTLINNNNNNTNFCNYNNYIENKFNHYDNKLIYFGNEISNIKDTLTQIMNNYNSIIAQNNSNIKNEYYNILNESKKYIDAKMVNILETLNTNNTNSNNYYFNTQQFNSNSKNNNKQKITTHLFTQNLHTVNEDVKNMNEKNKNRKKNFFMQKQYSAKSFHRNEENLNNITEKNNNEVKKLQYFKKINKKKELEEILNSKLDEKLNDFNEEIESKIYKSLLKPTLQHLEKSLQNNLDTIKEKLRCNSVNFYGPNNLKNIKSTRAIKSNVSTQNFCKNYSTKNTSIPNNFKKKEYSEQQYDEDNDSRETQIIKKSIRDKKRQISDLEIKLKSKRSEKKTYYNSFRKDNKSFDFKK